MTDTHEKTEAREAELLRLTAQIVSAHCSKNEVPLKSLTDTIQDVYATLANAAENFQKRKPKTDQPAVPIETSIHDDFLICLEDGKHVVFLAKHLKRFHLTPDQYRNKWGLTPEYPMVPPNYRAQRQRTSAKTKNTK
jgi:predicted transcriptional regulator